MRAWIAVVLFSVGMPALAAEQELTPLQPPTVIVPAPFPYPAFEQPSRLAVWQYYAVDRSGHFRPRIPLTTEPFNKATVQPRIYIPYIFD